jgi:hypothetical protein
VYNVTLRHIHITIVAVEKQELLNIMSVSVFLPELSDMQIASFVHCIILSSVACLALPTIFFPSYLINGTIFGKKLLDIKCVSVFSTAFVCNISHSMKNSVRC